MRHRAVVPARAALIRRRRWCSAAVGPEQPRKDKYEPSFDKDRNAPEPPAGVDSSQLSPIMDRVMPEPPRWAEPDLTPERQAYRMSKWHGRLGRGTYFDSTYDKYDLIPLEKRGRARWYDLPPENLRHTRYSALTFEQRLHKNAILWYQTGKFRHLGAVLMLGGLVYLSNYLSLAKSVDMPDEIAEIDTAGTGCCVQLRFFLPDFKLMNALAAERDSYCKKWTASVFSSAFFYPERRLMGFINPDYFARPYHFHFRRLVAEGELFSTHRITKRTRTSTLLRSEVTGSYAQCVAEVGDDGILNLRLATCLSPDSWLASRKGNPVADYAVLPAVAAVSSLAARWWVTSASNFFLRHHCSDVTLKPLDVPTTLLV